MAANLVKAGHTVNAFDLVQGALDEFVKAGGVAASSASEAVIDAQVVISMLPAGKHVAGLYLGDEQGAGGLLAQITKGSLVIDSSTIDAETSRRVGVCANDLGINFVDAPVSGGTAGAKAGTLSFIVGGEKIAFEQMGVENGLDAKVLSDIMVKSSGRNWALEIYNPVPGVMEGTPASNGYEGGFMVDLMNKDLGLALSAAQASDSSVPMGEQASKLFKNHGNAGYGGLDFSSIYQHYSNKKA
jgi:3-hydroxyisobutyrate dehydrogenase